EHLHEDFVVGGLEHAVDGRMRAVEPRERRRDEPRGQRSERSELDAAATSQLRHARRLDAFVQHVEDAAGVGKKALAQRRNRDPAASPEQRAAELVLEALDPRADRGLSDPERERAARLKLPSRATRTKAASCAMCMRCSIDVFDAKYRWHSLEA